MAYFETLFFNHNRACACTDVFIETKVQRVRVLWCFCWTVGHFPVSTHTHTKAGDGFPQHTQNKTVQTHTKKQASTTQTYPQTLPVYFNWSEFRWQQQYSHTNTRLLTLLWLFYPLNIICTLLNYTSWPLSSRIKQFMIKHNVVVKVSSFVFSHISMFSANETHQILRDQRFFFLLLFRIFLPESGVEREFNHVD